MDTIEYRIIEIIDQNKEKIIDFGRDIYTHAELGYKEFRTSKKFAEDRSDQLREQALKQDLACTMENFMEITDLPMMGWVKELGRNHCPYAETWVKYFEEFPWVKKMAPFYCDVIDTTNSENFTQALSHKITENVLTGGESCEREYFASEQVAKGVLTYGEKIKEK